MMTVNTVVGKALALVLLSCCTLSDADPPLSTGKLASSNTSLQWGPYRPNLYVGIRSQIPDSLLMGLMWSNVDDGDYILKHLRHTCEQDEGMAGYGWTSYDPRTGGVHIVNDTGHRLDLITQFAKISENESQGKWGMRVTGRSRADASAPQRTALIFYLGVEKPNSLAECGQENHTNASTNTVICSGKIAGIEHYKLSFSDLSAQHVLGSTSVLSLKVPGDSVWQAKSIFMHHISSDSSSEGKINNNVRAGNLHFVQLTFTGDFDFDVLFSSEADPQSMNSITLTDAIGEASLTFRDRFDDVYSPQPPFRDEKHSKFSQSLLSNLMGGIGYFHGTSKVDVSSAPDYAETDENFWEQAASARTRATVEEMGPYHLFTSVPSRPFFPRGFLWDEGFHLQVIMDWDMDLALDIVSSWFDLMDENGWIAREQILGPEARSKVPSEFQTQYPHYANPPTLFLVIQAFVERLNGTVSYAGAPSGFLSDQSAGKAFLTALYSKLKKHYEWFRRTQAGGNMTAHDVSESDHGYRWRGRTPQHILTSGMDDYPRSQPPHPRELHVDALCWVGTMAITLTKISAFLGEKQDEVLFSRHKEGIIQAVDSIHWSESKQAYCDARVDEGGRLQRICHKGYISLFPFFTGLMGPDDPHLAAVLNLIRDPEELRSPYGLRSLSLKDEYYGTGENYWRGPIWININYMVIDRLLELAQQPGPHQRKMRETYIHLRQNLVNTVFCSWEETGFAWEQYNSDTGKGQRTQHFTGWTALIVRIMAMPDLRPQDAAEYISKRNPEDGWSLTSIVMGMMLVGFVWYLLRRRLMGVWRWIMRP